MTRFDEPMINIVKFATPDVITTSGGGYIDDVDVATKGGYNDMKDIYGLDYDPFKL